ncbi:pectinesterase family protein [Galbibacter sp. EGI 63066]|uniref:pectinesterase family protein n=1 Tax=Galbibacter sp. EGI 63066 TaxID=2993559 RepID=UPI002248C089|nr:pectinesterase family protein [Galbibacter sp. EGI 63066]MCX2678394.1 pectinesterase family protein [Galbibacter sp. EGI 63066]
MKTFLIYLLLSTSLLHCKDKPTSVNQDNEFTVAKDGSGDYTSIQAAINDTKSFPYEQITIHIKEGVYHEKVKIYEWNPKVTLIGENKERTIIRYDDYFKGIDLGRNSTFHTSTLQVEGNDCFIKNLTIENTAGNVGQAVALSLTGNRIKVENCIIKGNQDTVYTSGEGHKQYFKDCFIEGTTDFIFGQATAVFDGCQIHSKSDSYITAASTPEHIPFGYVFINCRLTADKNVTKVYLGRPWRIYAKTVFINCEMGKQIHPEAWHDWNKPEAHTSAFYAEYNSSGKGADNTKRVRWSHQLNDKDIQQNYSLKKILIDSLADQDWYKIKSTN